MYGSTIKSMSKLAIYAIIFIVIMHIISWIPIVSDGSELREDLNDHKENHSYDYRYDSDCDKCDNYKEKIAEYDKLGADLWQTTVTNCVLIALCGVIANGVGTLVEQKQRITNTPYQNGPMQ